MRPDHRLVFSDTGYFPRTELMPTYEAGSGTSPEPTPGGAAAFGAQITLFTCWPSGQVTGTGKKREPSAVGMPMTCERGTVVPSAFLLRSPFSATFVDAPVMVAACSTPLIWA